MPCAGGGSQVEPPPFLPCSLCWEEGLEGRASWRLLPEQGLAWLWLAWLCPAWLAALLLVLLPQGLHFIFPPPQLPPSKLNPPKPGGSPGRRLPSLSWLCLGLRPHPSRASHASLPTVVSMGQKAQSCWVLKMTEVNGSFSFPVDFGVKVEKSQSQNLGDLWVGVGQG